MYNSLRWHGFNPVDEVHCLKYYFHHLGECCQFKIDDVVLVDAMIRIIHDDIISSGHCRHVHGEAYGLYWCTIHEGIDDQGVE